MRARSSTEDLAGERTTVGWVTSFVRFVGHLVRRPRRGERLLPLIWLVGQGSGVIDAVEKAVRVPSARIRADREFGDAGVRSLLDALHRALSSGRSGPERLRFGHYTLLTWVMDQNLSDVGPDAAPAELARLLRKGHRRTPRPAGQDRPDSRVAEFLPPWGRLLWWLVGILATNAMFRAMLSGRVPGIGRRYRWFMSQQYLAPKQSTTFVAFAERLTEGNLGVEDPEQVDKLLVHTFLQDLRRAYSRRPWRLQGWRRTAYPLVMIDNVPDAGDVRYTLVRLLNEVRNETGRSDPLLLLCAGEHSPPGTVAAPSASEGPEVDLEGIYERWDRGLPDTRRALARAAWVLPLDLPGQVETGSGRGALRVTAPKPPWFARRFFVCAAVAVLCVPLVVWGLEKAGGPGCPHLPFRGAISVREIGGECVGYSDNAGFKFNDQPGQGALRDVQDRIFLQNRQARDDWRRSHRRRPYVTVVYLGTLTGRAVRANEEAYAAEREELEGLAVAQFDGLQEPGSAYGKPLLHVVIANAGYQMRHAAPAADMIADLARRDPTVEGVIGLVESRTDTVTALTKLNRIGMMAIAPNLSADGLYRNSTLYLQIAPPNRDQARMVAEYARRVLRVSGTHIYYSVGDNATLDSDLYVSTLRQDLIQEFGSGHDRLFTPGASLSEECGYKGMLFFAGRWSDFPNFLDGLKRDCVNDMPKHLVADDSVNRYMANRTIRPDAPGNLPLTYVSKAALATCGQLAARARTDGTGSRFLGWIQAPNLLDPRRCSVPGGSRPVGERVGLAYDSTMMMLQAVEALAGRVQGGAGRPWNPRSISPLAVYTEILHQNGIKAFPAVTGNIQFKPDDPGEPVNKRISLLSIASIPDLDTAPKEVFHCGVGALGGTGASSAPRCTR